MSSNLKKVFPTPARYAANPNDMNRKELKRDLEVIYKKIERLTSGNVTHARANLLQNIMYLRQRYTEEAETYKTNK